MARLSFSFLWLLTVAVHQSSSQSFWKTFRSKYWEPKGPDPLDCYRTLTLELFENLREVADRLYVKLGEDEFKSKVKPRSKFFSFFRNDETEQELFKKRLKEAERVAASGISSIRQWLTYHCTDEKLKEIMTITETFRKGRAKCGDPDYLSISIMLLETACHSRPPYAWKSSIHGLQDDPLDSTDE